MPGHCIFQLKITLEDTTPPIWRRLLVPGDIRLSKLHRIFQAAMGWTNSHLHSFTVGPALYGMHVDDWPDEEIDEEDVTVLDALRGHKSCRYEYDFGDGWEHRVEVEAHTSSDRGLKHAVCLAGANACPPEDCGGPSGFQHLLDVLGDPSDEQYADLLAWVGGAFEASAFDLAQTNAALQRVP